MRPLPSPNSINSRDARQTATNWAAIYRPFSNMLGIPTEPARNTMRSSKSQLNLKALPESMEGLAVDRTANSTPAASHKKDISLSQNAMLTPPSDKKVESTDQNEATKQYSSHNNSSNIYLQSQAEDDVFSGDTLPKRENIPKVPVAGQDVVQQATQKAANNTIAPVTGQEMIQPAIKNAIAPRPDRLMGPITSANAQGVFPPSHTVFVANLPVHRTDQQLEESCHGAFDQFGQCIVKVGHDGHNHPYAHITYYTSENADRAINEGRELVIDGRALRTEHGDCRREYTKQSGNTGSSLRVGSVIFSRIGGGAVTREEAKELLSKYGSIEEMHPTTHADFRTYGVPEGMWVKFGFVPDYQDCLKQFNNPKLNESATLFKVSEAPNLEPRSRRAIPGGSPVFQPGLRTPKSINDQKSIFVGNLPEDITEAELLEIFASYGQIKGCNVIRKPIEGGQGLNIFGFIEFATTDEAAPASVAEVDIRGQRIRVEPKEYSLRRHTRLQSSRQPPSAERPRGIHWGRSTNFYQPPGTHWQYDHFYPYGVPTGGYPFHPVYQLQPGYPWIATPPNSAHRQRAPIAEPYIMPGSSPEQFLPTHQAQFAMTQSMARAMAQYCDAGAENSQPPPARRC